MKASTERTVLRWLHFILSIPIIGYIYGPVADKPYAVTAIRYLFVPVVILSGIWMWKGQAIKKWLRKVA